jgi:phage gp36-like protein
MSFTFIDFKPYISEKDFRQITEDVVGENSAPIIDQVYAVAIQVIKDALYSRYDIDVIIPATGPIPWDTYPQVKRWAICLCLYYLHERIADRLVPERVLKNYDDTLEMLDKIADAKISISLPHLLTSEGELKSKFRWGSSPARTH